ncbi:unnamed protein product, partial [Polarella glacialis]
SKNKNKNHKNNNRNHYNNNNDNNNNHNDHKYSTTAILPETHKLSQHFCQLGYNINRYFEVRPAQTLRNHTSRNMDPLRACRVHFLKYAQGVLGGLQLAVLRPASCGQGHPLGKHKQQ